MNQLALKLYEKGRKLTENGNYKAASIYLLNALKEDVMLVDAHIDLAYCFAMENRFEDAKDHCLQAISLDPNNLEAYSTLAFIYHEYGLYEEEAKMLEGLKERLDNPGAAFYLTLGNAYYEMGKHDKAAENYLKAIEIEPDFAEAYANLGNAYFMGNQLEKAKNYYTKALSLDPTLPDVYYDLGSLYMELGEQLNALKCLKKAVKLNPTHQYAHYDLALLYNDLGNRKRALEEYEKLKSIDAVLAEELLDSLL